MQKVELFKPEDFHRYWMGKESACSPAQAAETANDILNKYLESCPFVYGIKNTYFIEENTFYNFDWQSRAKEERTHVARLAFIEELPKEPCKHEANVNIHLGTSSRIIESKCKHCGVDLVISWKEKK